jgi:AcrR family transcriptional regulator
MTKKPDTGTRRSEGGAGGVGGPSEPLPGSRGEARRQAFLDAARETFLEQGFARASVNEVVRRAGGSLTTLYQQFGDKEGLFKAVMDQRSQLFAAALDNITAAHMPLREGLQSIGVAYLTAMLRPEALAMYRVVMGEAIQFPEIAKSFVEFGPRRIVAAVGRFMAEQIELGAITVADPTRAAEVFCDMTRGSIHIQALTEPGFILTPEEIRDRVAVLVAIFIDGAGKQQPA